MGTYILRRVLLAVLTLWVVTVIVALLMREALPGDVVDVLAAERFYSDSEKDRLRDQLGFDRGFGEYYVDWISDAATGDFGASLRTERDIGTDLILRFPVTIELAILGLIFAMAISLPLGVISAIRRNTWVDYSARSAAVFALAIPGFWLATLAVVFGAKWFGWSPPLGFEQIWDDPRSPTSVKCGSPQLLYGLHLGWRADADSSHGLA